LLVDVSGQLLEAVTSLHKDQFLICSFNVDIVHCRLHAPTT